MKIRAALVATVTLVTLVLGACNTTEGAGKDISSAGNAISHQAQKDK